MKRIALVTLAVAVALVHSAAGQSDALAALRLALGGEAALAGITSVHISGKITAARRIGSGHVDVYLESPDRFVRITRLPAGMTNQAASQGRLLTTGRIADQDPASIDRMALDLNIDESVTETRYGFNGDAALRSDHGVSAWESVLGNGRHQYARVTIPLLAGTTAAYRTEATSETNVVRYAGADGAIWLLSLDPVTHLPSSLAWQQMTMTFSDYRKVGAVTWPFHLVTVLSGQTVEDTRVDKYEINKKISPKTFK